MKVVYIHGTRGSPDENWAPWLAEQLEEQGHAFLAPRFPTPEDQSLENWLEVWEEARVELDADTVIVAHSLGPAFAMRLLEEQKEPIRGAVFVSGFIGLLGDEEFDPLNESFTMYDFTVRKVREGAQKFVLLHGDDDPYVSLRKALGLRGVLNAELHIIRGGGHLNEEAGYTELPQVLDAIESLAD